MVAHEDRAQQRDHRGVLVINPVFTVDQERTRKRKGWGTYCVSKGFVTLLNSRQADTPGFEHTVRLAQVIRDRSDVLDHKSDGVKVVGVIGEPVRRRCPRISFNKSNLRRCRAAHQ